MRILRQDDLVNIARERPVVTFGVFDGVHAGHQAVLRRAVLEAETAGAPAVLVTFDRHPQEVLSGAAPPSITSLQRRLELVESAGVRYAWIESFDRTLAETPAREFAERLFVRGLEARVVVMGETAVFGKGREGTVARLAEWGHDWGLRAIGVPQIVVDGQTASSSAIRALVTDGRLEKASHLLGRPFEVQGLVERGQELARRLGFPTANLRLHHRLRPPKGVYFAVADWGEGERGAVVSIGHRLEPDSPDDLVEAHIPDFDGDLYGKTLTLRSFVFRRGIVSFPSVEALIAAICEDVAAGVRHFGG